MPILRPSDRSRYLSRRPPLTTHLRRACAAAHYGIWRVTFAGQGPTRRGPPRDQTVSRGSPHETGKTAQDSPQLQIIDEPRPLFPARVAIVVSRARTRKGTMNPWCLIRISRVDWRRAAVAVIGGRSDKMGRASTPPGRSQRMLNVNKKIFRSGEAIRRAGLDQSNPPRSPPASDLPFPLRR